MGTGGRVDIPSPPPPPPGTQSPARSQKTASVSYCTRQRHWETLSSELSCSSFILIYALLRPLKMFPQGTVVRHVRSAKGVVLAVVQGPSPMVNSTAPSCTNVVPLKLCMTVLP